MKNVTIFETQNEESLKWGNMVAFDSEYAAQQYANRYTQEYKVYDYRIRTVGVMNIDWVENHASY